MGKIQFDVQKLEQHRKEMEELRLALTGEAAEKEKVPDGKGKAPEQLQGAGEKMDRTIDKLNHLMYETVQVLKRTEEEISGADQSAAHALEMLR